MAVTKTVSNEFKLELGKAAINFTSDVFKAKLMAPAFTFDKDAHGTVGDLPANEITAAGSYAELTLTVDTAWNQDNVNDKAYIDWADATWTASGAAFDDFASVIVYDATHASDVIVGCIDLGETVSLTDGNTFELQNIGFETA